MITNKDYTIKYDVFEGYGYGIVLVDNRTYEQVAAQIAEWNPATLVELEAHAHEQAYYLADRIGCSCVKAKQLIGKRGGRFSGRDIEEYIDNVIYWGRAYSDESWLQAKEEAGLTWLTGEACELNMRVLYDLSPEAVDAMRDVMGFVPTMGPRNRQDGAAVMLTKAGSDFVAQRLLGHDIVMYCREFGQYIGITKYGKPDYDTGFNNGGTTWDESPYGLGVFARMIVNQWEESPSDLGVFARMIVNQGGQLAQVGRVSATAHYTEPEWVNMWADKLEGVGLKLDDIDLLVSPTDGRSENILTGFYGGGKIVGEGIYIAGDDIPKLYEFATGGKG